MEDDAEELLITRENSAWDNLRDRFEAAAAEGRFLDLTDDADDGSSSSSAAAGRVLGREQATADFNQITPLPELSATVAVQTGNIARQSPELQPVTTAIQGVLLRLGTVREKLVASIQTGDEEISPQQIVKLNSAVRALQTKVNQCQAAVIRNPKLVHRVEELNKVVMKANLLISQFNRQFHDDDEDFHPGQVQNTLSYEENIRTRRTNTAENRSARYEARARRASATHDPGEVAGGRLRTRIKRDESEESDVLWGSGRGKMVQQEGCAKRKEAGAGAGKGRSLHKRANKRAKKEESGVDLVGLEDGFLWEGPETSDED